MKQIWTFFKKEIVLTVAWILAFVSAFFVVPDKTYLQYIDFRSLGILWSLMVVMEGMKEHGIFDRTGMWLLQKTKKEGQIYFVLVFVCFFSSMFITNDVALITFVPFTVLMLQKCNKEKQMIPVIVLQTIAANLGSMMTPIGNPQNLYLYGLSGMSLGTFVLNMLPYTILSGILLVGSLIILCKKADDGKNSVVMTEMNDPTSQGNEPLSKKVMVYGILFLLALLVVARILPYQILVVFVLVTVLCMERKILIQIDYALLFTFLGFFIFTGNMGRIESVKNFFAGIIAGREIGVSVVLSQCISNVPAALLLSGFTENYKQLLLGVNFGGLGTLIASLASLISYKIYANVYCEKKSAYFMYFTKMNLLFLGILLVVSFWF